MNSTQAREHEGLRLWLLLVTIGVALVAALGMGTAKAWADTDGAGTPSDPAQTALGIAKMLGANTITNPGSASVGDGTISVSDNVVTVTGNVTAQTTDSPLHQPFCIAIPSGKSVTIQVNGTLTLKTNEAAGFLIGGSGTVNITGSGTIIGGAPMASSGSSSNTGASYPAIQVGYPTMSDSSSATAGYPTVTVNMPGGGIQGTAGSDNANIGAYALYVNGSSVDLQAGTLSHGANIGNTSQSDVYTVCVTPDYSGGNSSEPKNASVTLNGATINAPQGSSSSSAGLLVRPGASDSNPAWGDVAVSVNSGTINGGILSTDRVSSTSDSGTDTAVNVNGGTVNGGITNSYTNSSVEVGGNAVVNNGVTTTKGSTQIDDNAVVNNGVTNSDGTTEIGGNATVNGNVENSGNGTTTVSGGKINGNLENSGQGGKLEWSGGQVTGTVDGVDKVTPPAEPGTAEALQGAVIGVKAPVTAAMAPYATVTVNSAGNVWNIEVVDGAEATPVSTVASTLVAPIVNAIASASSPSVTSVQNSALTITLPNTTDNVLAFSQGVLEAAVVNTDANLATPATLGELEGLTCGINAATNTGSVTYTFNFAGEAPEPPAADYEAVYRLYNPYDFLHIYTRDANEVATLKAQGWTVDFGGQPCWYAPVAGSEDASYQVIRLYNPYSHDHYFVPASDTAQIDELTGLGWQKDSAASAIWSAPADGEGSVEVYTLFNRFNQVDTHLWTASKTEVDTLVGPDAWELNTTTMWGVTPA